jgi:hypothetical protein
LRTPLTWISVNRVDAYALTSSADELMPSFAGSAEHAKLGMRQIRKLTSGHVAAKLTRVHVSAELRRA